MNLKLDAVAERKQTNKQTNKRLKSKCRTMAGFSCRKYL